PGLTPIQLTIGVGGGAQALPVHRRSVGRQLGDLDDLANSMEAAQRIPTSGCTCSAICTLFDPRSGVQIQRCDRYRHEQGMGARIVSTRDWQAGESVSMLIGCAAELTPDEEAALPAPGLIYSSRRQRLAAVAGPLPPTSTTTASPTWSWRCSPRQQRRPRWHFYRTIRPIKRGQEVLLYYGPDFFGPGNCQ
uniref:SET domain-containing protein n=1 Tax=Macrostomum lignano TaxID=282301 RepID=A0A1I8FBK9_9PLAT